MGGKEREDLSEIQSPLGIDRRKSGADFENRPRLDNSFYRPVTRHLLHRGAEFALDQLSGGTGTMNKRIKVARAEKPRNMP